MSCATLGSCRNGCGSTCGRARLDDPDRAVALGDQHPAVGRELQRGRLVEPDDHAVVDELRRGVGDGDGDAAPTSCGCRRRRARPRSACACRRRPSSCPRRASTGAAVSSAPRSAPSSRNCTPATPRSSLALAATVTVPVTGAGGGGGERDGRRRRVAGAAAPPTGVAMSAWISAARERAVVDAHLVDERRGSTRPRRRCRRSAARRWRSASVPVWALLATCVPLTYSRSVAPS